MNEMFSIAGKVAVITGAGGVLGGSMARHFVSQGAKVAVLDIRQEQLDNRVKELEELGGDVMGFICNVLDMEAIERTAEAVVKRFGKVDILLNIAGGNMPGATLEPEQPFFKMGIEYWDKVTALNINGTVYPSYVFSRVMAEQGSGCIVNISSMAAYSAITRVPGYSVAKTGISSFTQWLAADMALKFGDKIRVNALAPGMINTSFHDRFTKPEARENLHHTAPLRREGEASEVADLVCFLACDESSYLTGTNIDINGGCLFS